MNTLVIKIEYKSSLKRFTFSSDKFTLLEVQDACRRRFVIPNTQEVVLQYDDVFKNSKETLQTNEQLRTAIVHQQVKKLYMLNNQTELELDQILMPILQTPEIQNQIKQQLQQYEKKQNIVLKACTTVQWLEQFMESILTEFNEEKEQSKEDNDLWKPDSSFLTLTQFKLELDMPTPKQEYQLL